MTPHRTFALTLGLALLLACGAAAQTTSTLAAETGNNTSASSFPQHDNGNVAAGNVSKLDTHTLLYPGATTSIYAHLVPWFCMPGTTGTDGIQRCNGHILTGYNSNDATTVKNQVSDMISRGINGMIIDWYGSAAAIEKSGIASWSRCGDIAKSTRPSNRSSPVVTGLPETNPCPSCGPITRLPALTPTQTMLLSEGNRSPSPDCSIQ